MSGQWNLDFEGQPSAQLAAPLSCTRANGLSDSQPAFRQRDPIVCAWCYGGNPSGEEPSFLYYCSSGCAAAASAAPVAERRRRIGEARKRMGLDTTERNHQAEVAIARWLALRAFGRLGSGTIDDVRDIAHACGIWLDWTQNWPGGVLKKPWFEPLGIRRTGRHVAGNARKVNVYRLTTEGREALRGLRNGK